MAPEDSAGARFCPGREDRPVIAAVEVLSATAGIIHLALLWWLHEGYEGPSVWPVLAALGLVILSGLAFSTILAGGAAPGFWLAWQGADVDVFGRCSGIPGRCPAGLRLRGWWVRPPPARR